MVSAEVVSSFIEGAPPGELNEVVNSIKALTSDSEPSLLQQPKVKAAFQRYNESQLVCTKLPGGSQYVNTHPPAAGLFQKDAQLVLTRLSGPGLALQPRTARLFVLHRILRHNVEHILHLRPHNAKGEQPSILHPRFTTRRPKFLDTKVVSNTLRRTLPTTIHLTYLFWLSIHHWP